MAIKLEIHKIEVENKQVSSSVQGKMSGASYKGIGAVSGESNTKHTSSIFANSQIYQLKQTNQQYPFRDGDTIILLCRKNKKNGIYEFESFINVSNGTRLMPNIATPNFYIWGLFLLSIPLIFIFIGLVIFPITLGFGIWYSFFFYPRLRKAYEAMEQIAMLSPDQVNERIKFANASIN